MRFSEQWLRTYVDPPLSTRVLAEKLTMAGLEVEELAPVAPPFSGVVVGRIDSVAPHPSADRLRVTISLDQNSALSVHLGDPVTVKVFAPKSKAVDGKIVRTGYALDPRNQTRIPAPRHGPAARIAGKSQPGIGVTISMPAIGPR